MLGGLGRQWPKGKDKQRLSPAPVISGTSGHGVGVRAQSHSGGRQEKFLHLWNRGRRSPRPIHRTKRASAANAGGSEYDSIIMVNIEELGDESELDFTARGAKELSDDSEEEF